MNKLHTLLVLCLASLGFVYGRPGPEPPTWSFRGLAPATNEYLAPWGHTYVVHELGSFVVPEMPDGATLETHRLRETLTNKIDLLTGGQNRSGATHPGIAFGEGGVHFDLRFLDAARPEGSHIWQHNALGALIRSRAIQQWDPTEPAAPEAFILDPAKWPAAFARGVLSIYWGQGAPGPDPGFEGSWSLPADEAPAPGTVIDVVLFTRWDVPGWPGGHQWPYRYDAFEDIALTLRWEPTP